MAHKLLGIYLNDHLAGSEAGLGVARRCRDQNADNEYGRALDRLIPEIEEDQARLLAIMGHLGVRTDPLKRTAGRLAERAGRLKLNGRLGSYSPLSRLEELEVLGLGIEGKRALWVALHEAEKAIIDLAGFDLGGLIVRAEGQRKVVEDLRLEAARAALTEG